MVCDYPLGDFYLAAGQDIARGRLEEEEWFFGRGIVEFFDVLCVVSSYRHNLKQGLLLLLWID